MTTDTKPGDALMREAMGIIEMMASTHGGRGQMAALKDMDDALMDDRKNFQSLRRVLLLAYTATLASDHEPEWAALFREKASLLMRQAAEIAAAVELLAMRPAGEAVN